MLSQSDFLSLDMEIVVNLWWMFKVKCFLPSIGKFILLGKDKTILQKVIVMGQPQNWVLETLQSNL